MNNTYKIIFVSFKPKHRDSNQLCTLRASPTQKCEHSY